MIACNRTCELTCVPTFKECWLSQGIHHLHRDLILAVYEDFKPIANGSFKICITV